MVVLREQEGGVGLDPVRKPVLGPSGKVSHSFPVFRSWGPT